LRFLKKNSPYLDQKNLEVAIFRQCVPVGRRRIPKKSTSPPGQSPFIAN
jgi:hypothetical protein